VHADRDARRAAQDPAPGIFDAAVSRPIRAQDLRAVLRRWLGDYDAKAGAHRVAHRANDQPKVEHAETEEYEVDAATAAAARILIVEGDNHHGGPRPSLASIDCRI
jgi:heme-degrading monooxygenase HmoA